MGAVAHVLIAAEDRLPPCIVQALSFVEGHPVLHLGGIFILALAAPQCRRALFKGEREDAGSGILAESGISGHYIALDKECAVNIVPHVLGTDADFDVCAGQIICAAPSQIQRVSPGTQVLIDRFALHGFPREDILCELLCFQVFKDRITVFIQSCRECDCGSQGSLENAVHIAGLILFRKLADVFRDLILLDRNLAVLDLQPVHEGLKSELLCLISEHIGDCLIGIVIEDLAFLHQFFVVSLLFRRNIQRGWNLTDDFPAFFALVLFLFSGLGLSVCGSGCSLCVSSA